MDIVAGPWDFDESSVQGVGHSIRIVCSKRPMLPTNDEGRALNGSPLIPVRARLRGLQGGHDDVDVEPGPKPVRRLLESIDPCMRGQAFASKEVVSCLTRRKRDRPGLQRGSDIGRDLRSRFTRGRFRNDEAFHQIGPLRDRQECGLAAQRLPDQDYSRTSEAFDHRNDVSDVRSPREIARSPLASSVATLVEGVDPRYLRQPRGGLRPLSCVTGESMEQEHGRPLSAEVAAGKTPAVSYEFEPGLFHQAILALSIRWARWLNWSGMHPRTPISPGFV